MKVTSVLRPLNALEVNTSLGHLVEWAHVTELLHLMHSELNCSVNLFLGGKAANTKANRGVRHVLLHPERPQHI